MQKRFALLFILLILFIAIVPAYWPPDDETLRQSSSLYDVYSHHFTATGTFNDFNHNHGWTGASLSWDIVYHLKQYVPSSTVTRPPPA